MKTINKITALLIREDLDKKAFSKMWDGNYHRSSNRFTFHNIRYSTLIKENHTQSWNFDHSFLASHTNWQGDTYWSVF